MDKTIISAIEKLSRTWRILHRDFAKRQGLSPLQAQIVDFVGKTPPRYSGITPLARELGLTKATISEAVDSLLRKGIVAKKTVSSDRRRFQVRLTPKGKGTVENLSAWDVDVKEQLARFTPERKGAMLMFLMELIQSLQEADIIDSSRICLLCENYTEEPEGDDAIRHCKLRANPLKAGDLRIDCRSFTPRDSLAERRR
jgi:DNA-binding MarR family transcriptional regulator